MTQSLLNAPHVMAIVPSVTIVHPELPDKDDNRILEVAIAAHADLIVTGDSELLALQRISAPHIIESLAKPVTEDDLSFPIMKPVEALDYLLSLFHELPA